MIKHTQKNISLKKKCPILYDYAAHQAVSRFAEHHIDLVSCIHRKCQTRAGASGGVNKSFDCGTN